MDSHDQPEDLNRRVFVKGLGYVGLGLVFSTMLGGCETIIENIKNRPIRRRLRTGSTAVNNDIAIYTAAVNAMKALPASDPRSWTAQAALHGVGNTFNYCQHGTNHFFSWHRAYLLYFERICQTLSGEPKFGLPYWNWNQNPGIHSAFLDSSSALYDNTRVNTTVSGNSAFEDDTLNPIFEDTNFYTFSSQVEGTPHNTAHVVVNGNMVTGGSPLDPVFWAHHCMVDYCWAKWNIELDNDNTNDSGWLNTSWDHFVDGNGNPVTVSAATTILMPLLSYQYECSKVGKFGCPLNLSALSKVEFQKLQDRVKKGTKVSFDIKKTVNISKQADVFLDKTASLRSRVSTNDFSALLNVDKKKERVFVRVKYAKLAPANDFFVRVFINLPTANSRTSTKSQHYAGSFAFFGIHDDTHARHGHKTDYLVNITDTLKKLQRSGKIRTGEAISVQLVAVPANEQMSHPGAKLGLQGIDFIVSPVTVRAR